MVSVVNNRFLKLMKGELYGEGFIPHTFFQAAKGRRIEVLSMLIDYFPVGDYFLPGVVLDEPPRELAEPITRYGAIRRSFLREHRPITYSQLLLSEKLFPHLRQVQQEAENRLNGIMSEILVFNPPPDKAADGLAWAAHMGEVRRIAEKMMLDEIVYV